MNPRVFRRVRHRGQREQRFPRRSSRSRPLDGRLFADLRARLLNHAGRDCRGPVGRRNPEALKRELPRRGSSRRRRHRHTPALSSLFHRHADGGVHDHASQTPAQREKGFQGSSTARARSTAPRSRSSHAHRDASYRRGRRARQGQRARHSCGRLRRLLVDNIKLGPAPLQDRRRRRQEARGGLAILTSSKSSASRPRRLMRGRRQTSTKHHPDPTVPENLAV